ncbi:glycosyltransferase 87 family protein [Streptomyces carpaticus]|uniref:Glycosyltransferase 87 family protein n=1 Tax=Streptomyces carpaticus TaxID=285558 RepID=A0ABV4ZQ60_9ACTN
MVTVTGGGVRGRARRLRRGGPWLVLALCALSFIGCALAQRALGLPLGDLDVYRAEGWAVRTGEDLYDLAVSRHALQATYPPFAALLFVPLTLLGVEAMRVLVCVLNFGLVIVLAQLSLRLTGIRPAGHWRWAVPLAVAAVAVWSEPVWATVRYGQINLLLAVLVLWDLTRPAHHRFAGVATGIAIGIKLTPAIFAVLCTVAGVIACVRRRDTALLPLAGRAWAAFAGTVALGALVLPAESWRYWTDLVLAEDRVGAPEASANQSLRGVLARMLHTGELPLWWLPLVAGICCAGLTVAVAALLTGRRAWAVVACAVTALLVSPVSWSHHWVWAVPAVLLLVAEARDRRGARGWWPAAGGTTLLFCSYVSWLLPHDETRPELDLSPGQQLLAAGYPLAGLALLAAATAAVTAPRGSPAAGAARRPAGSSAR